MRPTRVWDLVAAAVVGLAVSYLLLRTYYLSDLATALPRTPALSIAIAAVALAELARVTRARQDGRPRTKPILPITVARFAALARAASLVGALLAGGWIGVLAYTLPRGDSPPVAGADVITAVLGLAASVCLVAAALWLERTCRVKR